MNEEMKGGRNKDRNEGRKKEMKERRKKIIIIKINIT